MDSVKLCFICFHIHFACASYHPAGVKDCFGAVRLHFGVVRFHFGVVRFHFGGVRFDFTDATQRFGGVCFVIVLIYNCLHVCLFTMLTVTAGCVMVVWVVCAVGSERWFVTLGNCSYLIISSTTFSWYYLSILKNYLFFNVLCD